jgi:hypothetical protein
MRSGKVRQREIDANEQCYALVFRKPSAEAAARIWRFGCMDLQGSRHRLSVGGASRWRSRSQRLVGVFVPIDYRFCR